MAITKSRRGKKTIVVHKIYNLTPSIKKLFTLICTHLAHNGLLYISSELSHIT